MEKNKTETKVSREPTYKRFITGNIERFDERNTGYSRADRREIAGPDEALRHGLEAVLPKNQLGFLREDYALNLAGRAIDTLARKKAYGRTDFPRRWALPLEKMAVTNAAEMSEKVKKVGKWFGASLVGVAEINRLWLYACWGDHNARLAEGVNPGDPLDLPPEYRYVVAIAVEMDYTDIQRSPAVTPAIDLAYSKMAFTATMLAEFIRLLGYSAIPSGNDTGLSIPMAVDTGLGEMGRNGQLITEAYGPRVRLCKVFTDLPLLPDKPIDLGVQHFCETCGKCVKYCPGGAISRGERTDQQADISTNPGMLKWPVHSEKCLSWWHKSGTTGCTNCIRVCPYNKLPGSMHALVRSLLKRTAFFDRLILWGDDLMGYGNQVIRETPFLR
jgi:reductive dehalogenase